MAGEDLVELKFRLAYGTDIGPTKTLAESRLPVVEVPGGVITTHVVLRLPSSDKNNGNPRPINLLSEPCFMCQTFSMIQYAISKIYPQRNNRMILRRKVAVHARYLDELPNRM
ncbi:hypothetical protein F3Y22_tig00110004pilonHSYRG00113 [Hibiscus syriacus]|uniref:UBL3-like ubiquitin domain-containing protein n=1 Tax=Hibiscus syriacus TaxID=106335 RepID=A0A6A3BP12_HIBSY|nr:hypothetical protein F3Y22_tig00110004pilonHSYRG00113 [Hibiscus syriacus]